jgi:hypothetical protein
MKLKLSILFLLSLSVSVLPQTSIRGQLLKDNGKPLSYTEIELVPLDSDKLVVDARLLAVSSLSGKFTFFNVPDGKYTLSINFDDKPTDLSPYSTFFYPKTEKRADAEIFTIEAGKPLKTIIFQLPAALKEIKLSGKVTFPDGDAVEGAYIFIRDVYFDKFFTIGRIRSDQAGSFSLRGFGGRKYQVGAILYEKQYNSAPDFYGKLLAAAETDIFELSPTTSNLTLVLGKEDKDFNRLRDKYVGQFSSKSNYFVDFGL